MEDLIPTDAGDPVLARIFNSIERTALEQSFLYEHNKQRRPLWSRNRVPSLDQLSELVELASACLRDESLTRGISSRAFPSRRTRSNKFGLENSIFRQALSRKLLEAAAEIENIPENGRNDVRSFLEARRSIQEAAEGTLYYSVHRRHRGRVEGNNVYDYVIVFHSINGQLVRRPLSGLMAELEKTISLPDGCSLQFAISSTPHFSSAAPRGRFGSPGNVAAPGYSVRSPRGQWSSMTCVVARRDKPDVPLLLGSGHGLTDFFTAGVGDTVYRPTSATQEVAVAEIVDLSLPVESASHPPIPILKYDLAVARILDPAVASNALTHAATPRIMRKIKSLRSNEYQRGPIEVEKIGAGSQHKTGQSTNNKAIGVAVDDLGDVVTLIDQMSVSSGQGPFARLCDSGGLIFRSEKSGVAGVAGISAANGRGGAAGISYGSNLENFLLERDYILYGGGND